MKEVSGRNRTSPPGGALPELRFHPLTPDRWRDFEELFGKKGACGGCWCMWWLLRRSDFQRKQGAANKRAMKKRVESGEVPGILAYLKHRPVGWCSLAPRERYPVLERSRILQRVDDMPVWSVVCFFHARDVRRLGLGRKLLRAALDYARKKGAKLVEGYPVEPRKGKMPDAFAWTGFASTFRKEGFEEVARRSATRPILRYRIAAGPK